MALSYTAAAAIGLVAAGALDLGLLRTRLLLRKGFWAAYGIIVMFQLVMNGVLTGLPVVRYDPTQIIGPRIVHAPVEDLAFGFALVLTTLSVWTWLGRTSDGPPAPRAPRADR